MSVDSVVNKLHYGDQILAAFIALKRPLSLSDIVDYVARVTSHSSSEVRAQVTDTLAIACLHEFVHRIDGNYVLAAGLCELEPEPEPNPQTKRSK